MTTSFVRDSLSVICSVATSLPGMILLLAQAASASPVSASAIFFTIPPVRLIDVVYYGGLLLVIAEALHFLVVTRYRPRLVRTFLVVDIFRSILRRTTPMLQSALSLVVLLIVVAVLASAVFAAPSVLHESLWGSIITRTAVPTSILQYLFVCTLVLIICECTFYLVVSRTLPKQDRHTFLSVMARQLFPAHPGNLLPSHTLQNHTNYTCVWYALFLMCTLCFLHRSTDVRVSVGFLLHLLACTAIISCCYTLTLPMKGRWQRFRGAVVALLP
jgi:hypothetical protein